MNEWPEPDFDKEWDGPDQAIPCNFCGADAGEPCNENCLTFAPMDIPGADVDWSNVAATSRSHQWEDVSNEA